MLNTPIDLHDKQTWYGGPQCSLQVTFAEEIAPAHMDRILDTLGVDGVYPVAEDTTRGEKVRYSASSGRRVCMWRISRKRVVGAVLITESRFVGCPHLHLCIPPVHMATVFGNFPWVTQGWRLSRETLIFHAAVLTRVRRLLRIAPVKGVGIEDEAMCKILRGTASGLFVLPEIAEHFGWPVRVTRGFLAEVDLDVLKR